MGFTREAHNPSLLIKPQEDLEFLHQGLAHHLEVSVLPNDLRRLQDSILMEICLQVIFLGTDEVLRINYSN